MYCIYRYRINDYICTVCINVTMYKESIFIVTRCKTILDNGKNAIYICNLHESPALPVII